MTTLYKPVLIETAEQAEALPAFTVARYIDGDVRAAIKTIDGLWESIPGFYGEEAHFPEDFIGWTALVPIEAEAKVTDETARAVLDRYYETETGHDWPEDTIALMRLAVTAALGIEAT